MEDIFESAVRTNGDLAGVFEFEGEASYFYLMRTSNADGQKIVGAIQVCAGLPDFEADDLLVEWDEEEEHVGLMIRGKLWAAFDWNGAKFGGDYKHGGTANISKKVLDRFETA
jgi:hypothetical protein